MGFLNKKTRVIDFCLTERGRDLLAKNQLRIAHYAFSDDLINYRDCQKEYIKLSGSFSEVVYKNYVALEATTLGGFGVPRDLSSFLYTCPEQRTALPTFTTDVSSSLTLSRVSEDVSFDHFVGHHMQVSAPDKQVVVVTERDDTLPQDRERQYVADQDLDRLEDGKPLVIEIVKT